MINAELLRSEFKIVKFKDQNTLSVVDPKDMIIEE